MDVSDLISFKTPKLYLEANRASFVLAFDPDVVRSEKVLLGIRHKVWRTKGDMIFILFYTGYLKFIESHGYSFSLDLGSFCFV